MQSALIRRPALYVHASQDSQEMVHFAMIWTVVSNVIICSPIFNTCVYELRSKESTCIGVAHFFVLGRLLTNNDQFYFEPSSAG